MVQRQGLDKLKTLDLRSSSSSLLSEDVEAAMAEAASSRSLSRSLDFFFDFFFFLKQWSEGQSAGQDFFPTSASPTDDRCELTF